MKRNAILAASVAGIAGLASVAWGQEIETFDSPNETQIGGGNFVFANPIEGSWSSSRGGTITDNPTSVTIVSDPTSGNGYGTAYHNFYSQDNPNTLDISGSNTLQFDVTINSGDSGFFVDLQDGEGDFWQYFWGYGLVGTAASDQAGLAPGFTITQGAQPNELIMDAPLASPTFNNGTGFDFTQLVLFRLEDDPGTAYDYSINLNDLSAITLNLPITWNNASSNNLWDTASTNWNNGSANALYTDGSAVTFDDNNPGPGGTPGNYSVSLNTTVSPGSITVNNSDGNYTISGIGGSIGGTGSLTKSGSGSLTLATPNTYSGGTTVTAGLLEIAQTSSTTSALPKGALSISGTGEVQLATNVTAGSGLGLGTSNVNITSLSIADSGTLDITNNHIIVDYTSPANDPISSIVAWIKSGYAGGTWAGDGITSSTAAANSSSYGIGYADAMDPGNPAGLSSGQIEIMYTLLGDANLDGKVNGADFTILASNFNQSGKAWDQGDFNYDGDVNGGDFTLLAKNFNQTAIQSALGAADLTALDDFAASNGISLTNVPEPVCGTMLMMTMAGVLGTRRRIRTDGDRKLCSRSE